MSQNVGCEQVRLELMAALDGEAPPTATTAAEAATIILDGVRAGQWRILVGEDARELDAKVRADPEAAYDPDFFVLFGQPELVGQRAK